VQRERFEHLVEEAVRSLPGGFLKYLENISVMVDDWHPESPNILGIYHGVPYQHRGPYYGNVAPDVITIYQRPIERICSSEEQIRDKVRDVVIHEVAHYFGFSETQLQEIERQDPDEEA
jgi:predicted Zn-dependent protease with MMP-like domain